MNEVIPLKLKQNVEANGINDILGKFSNFSLGQNSLLPILFIFMLNKNGAGLNTFNNFLNSGNGFGRIFSKFNLSTENIEKSLKTLTTINTSLGSNQNTAMISTFSTILEAIHKFTTIQELTNNLSNISTAVPIMRNVAKEKSEETSSNDPDLNYKMLDVISELLDDGPKQSVKQARDMMQTLSLLKGVNGVLGENKSGANSFNIKDMLGIVSPLLGAQENKFGDAADMIKMMEMFSLFNNTGNNSEKSNDSKNANVASTLNRKSKKFNKDKAIDIENYDEEDDDTIIDNLLDDLLGNGE